MSRFFSTTLLVLTFLLLSLAAALHEDEKGQRDWYEAHVGDVVVTALHPKSSSIKQLYVSSREGAFAALPLAMPASAINNNNIHNNNNNNKNSQRATAAVAGGLRWRHVLSSEDRVVCIIPVSDSLLLAATQRGSLLSVMPITGQVMRTDEALAELAGGVRVHSCYGDANAVTMAYTTPTSSTSGSSSSSSTLGVATLSLVDGTATKPMLHSFSSIITEVRMDQEGKTLWALLADGTVHVIVDPKTAAATTTSSKTTAVVGAKDVMELTAVSPNKEMIVRLKDRTYTVLSTATTTSKTTLPPCGKDRHCKYTFTQTGTLVVVERTSLESLEVKFGTSMSTVVTSAGHWAPSILLAHLPEGSKGRMVLLLKRCNTDLTLVVSTTTTTATAAAKSNGVLASEIAWQRHEGVASPAAVRIADPEMIAPGTGAGKSDVFGFRHYVYLLSTYGTLYRAPTDPAETVPSSAAHPGAHRFTFLADVEREVAKAVGVACTGRRAVYKRLSIDDGRALITAVYENTTALLVQLDAATGAVLATTKVPQYALSLGHMVVDAAHKVHVHPTEADLPTSGVYGIDLTQIATGKVSGVRVSEQGVVATTWQASIGGGHYPIAAHATAARSHVLSAESIRLFPNTTTKGTVHNEVRRKYPTGNIAVFAHFETYLIDEEEVPTLIITAIDIVTGATLATTAHQDAAGPVHLLIVDHVVLFHYFATDRQRYLLGVWEMFEQDVSVMSDTSYVTIGQIISTTFMSGKTPVASAHATLPPVVAAQVLQFPPGEITTMSVTTSFYGIARKMLLFATSSGHLYGIDLRAVLFGGQGQPKPDAPAFTYIGTPSHLILSHEHKVYQPRLFATSPTPLESSCHVILTGLDTFYVRVSGASGKAFDLLNNDFDYQMLLGLFAVFALVCVAARYFANRKKLKMQWA